MRSGNKQPLGISAHHGGLLTAVSVTPLNEVVGTPESQGFLGSHNYLSQQVGVRSSKTSQYGSVNRPSVVPHRAPRVLGVLLRVCCSA